jgi:magnesium-transporting ATPase (P-type)
MFLTSVAVAVAALPEGLVVTVTVILAVGMQKILRKKALVRKLEIKIQKIRTLQKYAVLSRAIRIFFSVRI